MVFLCAAVFGLVVFHIDGRISEEIREHAENWHKETAGAGILPLPGTRLPSRKRAVNRASILPLNRGIKV
jgi:hypothetical protein